VKSKITTRGVFLAMSKKQGNKGPLLVQKGKEQVRVQQGDGYPHFGNKNNNAVRRCNKEVSLH